MIQLSSKAARILYSIVASVIIILFWRNIGRITAILGLDGNFFLNQSIKALLLVLVAFILAAVVIKYKEIFSFLGLNGNLLKGFGAAVICTLPLYLVFPFYGNFNTELTFQVLYDKCILTGFKEELVFRAFMFGMLTGRFRCDLYRSAVLQLDVRRVEFQHMGSCRAAYADERSMACFHDGRHGSRSRRLDFQYCPGCQHCTGRWPDGLCPKKERRESLRLSRLEVLIFSIFGRLSLPAAVRN